jgi:membrane protein
MGRQSAELLQTAVQNASGKLSGTLATLVGIVALVVTASGVFTEMQQTLNVIWRAAPRRSTVSALLRSRATSLGLVAALGFLLLVSLVISAILTALSNYINAVLPAGHLILQILNFLASFVLITILFAAIYRVVPDRRIEWRDVIVGAVATSFLFTIGKFLIGLYLGSSTVASSYGAAGGLIIALLWVYYSAQIFLFGAEFTKVYAHHHGSRARHATPTGVS